MATVYLNWELLDRARFFLFTNVKKGAILMVN